MVYNTKSKKTKIKKQIICNIKIKDNPFEKLDFLG